MDRTAWLGTADAATIEGVRKPALLVRTEWRTAGPVPVPVSAEIMTLVTDPVGSADRFLHQAPALDPCWFGDLTASLAALARYSTSRRFRVHAAEEYAPKEVRGAITARTGQITAIRTPGAGLNSPLAAIITAENGTVFTKGVPCSARRVITQAREAAVAPLVQHISPALLWHLEDIAGWDVLGYQYTAGRHAAYQPGSPNLDMIVGLMNTLSEITVPGQTDLLKRAEDRWRAYVDEPEQADLFAGPTPDPLGLDPGQRAHCARPRLAHRLGLADPRRRVDRSGMLDPAAHGLRRSHRPLSRTAGSAPGYLHASRPRAHRRLRRSKRPTVGRDRTARPHPLDEGNGPGGA